MRELTNPIVAKEIFIKRFPNDLDSDNAFYWIGRSQLALDKLEKEVNSRVGLVKDN